MAIVLSLGLVAIYYANKSKEFGNMTIRKMFHILAFLLFLPGVIFNVKGIITPSIDEIDGFCIQLCHRTSDLHGICEVLPER
jgi:hypothetical protein